MKTTEEATKEATKLASEESKRTVAVFNQEDGWKLVDFLKENELLYNKRLMG